LHPRAVKPKITGRSVKLESRRMPRPTSIADDDLLLRLTREFRRVGYEGATLATLSKATGLKKASLYHRFPGGKEQMAREVLSAADEWLEAHMLEPLRSDRPAAERIEAMIQELDRFYEGGRQACLLNVLAAPVGESGPFGDLVRDALEKWIAALAATLEDMGLDSTTAQHQARRAIALVEGSLVVARGLGTTEPFEECLSSLRRELKVTRPSVREP